MNDITFETTDNVTFTDSTSDCRRHWQSVNLDGELIGAVCHIDGPPLKPVVVFFQKIVPDTEIPNLKEWYPSEDEGFVFAKFDTVQGLVDYHKEYATNTAKN